MPREWDRFTRVVHAGGRDEGVTALSPPIQQTSTFALPDAETGARYTQAKKPPEFYTRWGNPTNAHLERALSELEGAEAGLVTASGMGAISAAILTRARSGGHVVAQRSVYAATAELLDNVLAPRFGVDVTWVEPRDTAGFEAAVREDTAAVYLETPANPTLALSDIEAVAAAAHDAAPECTVMVDNTFANPLNQSPLALGADVALHSTTKSLGGHSDITGGAILSSQAFIEEAWYHLKILGPAADPFASWLVLRGLKTLALRTEKRNANAQALAEFLEGHGAVERVHYPGLKSHPQHDLARRQMRGFGGILSFETAGGYAAGKRFAEALELATLAVSLGGVETLVQHPASMTHGTLTAAQREAAGIDASLVRVSCGVEGAGDLIADFEQALDAI